MVQASVLPLMGPLSYVQLECAQVGTAASARRRIASQAIRGFMRAFFRMNGVSAEISFFVRLPAISLIPLSSAGAIFLLAALMFPKWNSHPLAAFQEISICLTRKRLSPTSLVAQVRVHLLDANLGRGRFGPAHRTFSTHDLGPAI